jgi:pimeloyl-ACP methyl ester carboxylesterase
VLHRAKQPIARLLLVGPFASERHSSYMPWVLWARYLAARGIEVLRFDYRGVGESDGVFEETSFGHWIEDLRQLASWFEDRSSNIPFVLHGLGIGGLLASVVFREGVGDALLLWSPPKTANQALRASLVRWVNIDQLFKYGEDRKRPSTFIQNLEADIPVEVDGYRWSGKLWRDSFDLCLPSTILDEVTPKSGYKRAVRIVNLTREASPLVHAGTVADDRARDFDWLFSENWQWISSSLECGERTRV